MKMQKAGGIIAWRALLAAAAAAAVLTKDM